MIIESIRLYNLNIPFSRTIRHGLYTRKATESIVAVLHDSNGNHGLGEGTPREYVTGEALKESLIAASLIAEKILNRSFDSFGELTAWLNAIGDESPANRHPAAFCAIETALLDLWARSENRPIYRLFDHQCTQNELTYSGVIPFVSKKEEFFNYVALVKKLRLAALKIKVVDHDTGLAQLKIIRQQLGSEIELRVDANAAFTADAAIQFINSAESIQLSAVEQPVAKDDLAGLQSVSARSPVPIIADESMYTAKGPYHLIDNDLCHGLNIRLSSCGGFHNARRIYQRARSKQMMVVVGAHVGETAILSFAGRNLAMLCSDARYLEGSFSKYVIQQDLVDEDISFGSEGRAPVPENGGLGIDVDPAAVEKWSDLYQHLAAQ